MPTVVLLLEVFQWHHLRQFCSVQGIPVPERYQHGESVEKSSRRSDEAG